MLDNELIVATRLVDAHSPERQHLVAILKADSRAALALAKPGSTNLGTVILEAEVNMAGCRARQVRDLALDPQARQTLFDERLDAAIELAN